MICDVMDEVSSIKLSKPHFSIDLEFGIEENKMNICLTSYIKILLSLQNSAAVTRYYLFSDIRHHDCPSCDEDKVKSRRKVLL